ncbi:hypothetical protein SVAN01_08866, partial [Stagonosporopsis vannaccii]
MASPSATPGSPDPPPLPFRFLDLPLELREQIYSLYFRPADRLEKNATLESQGFYGGIYRFDMRVLRVPVNHISSEGLVPIVCTERRADCFNDHHAMVQISAPFHQAVPEHAVVLLVDDVHLFAQTWYYSALSYPMLNDRLATGFVLRDPDLDDVDEGDEKDVPLGLQRQMLLPFGQVKGLAS